MREAWLDDKSAWPGMDVDVLLVADNTRHKGRITALVSLSSGGEVIHDEMPAIELDDGRTVYGIDCWWTKDVPEALG